MLATFKELFVVVDAGLTRFYELVEVKAGDVWYDGESSVVESDFYEEFQWSLDGLR